jgi:predicted phage-related endonuclease
MRTLNLIQGTPEWAAHRSQHWNASDAPSMLGVSEHRTRTQLLRELHSGVAREFSDYVQEHVVTPGHAYETHARAIAEKILGEDLYPCTGVLEGTRYSASFDGLTLTGDTVFEHKRMNKDLRAVLEVEGCTGADLPSAYQVQMEQQCMVSGAKRVLFMASEWDGEELVEALHCWYTPNADLSRLIEAGWQQLSADLATYEPGPAAAPAAVGRAPDQLPALRIELTGMVTESNLIEYRDRAIQVFQGISTDLQTDQDFADAEQTVKFCKDVEDRLKAAKDHALSKTASIDELFRAIDAISAEARAKRLQLDKLVSRRKEEIRSEIVQRGFDAVQAHYRTINATLGEHALQVPATVRADLAQAIKGRKTVSSLNDAVDAAVATAKIDASQVAERVRANIAVLSEMTAGHEQLFADRRQLVAVKHPEDLRNLVAARIAAHEQRETARLEAERERIRQEEADRLERERVAAEAAKPAPAPAPDGRLASMIEHGMSGIDWSPASATMTESPPCVSHAKPVDSGARIKLGDINGWIAPLSITAAGLASLGFKPVGNRGAAQLYAAVDFPRIVGALINVLHEAPARAAEKEAA